MAETGMIAARAWCADQVDLQADFCESAADQTRDAEQRAIDTASIAHFRKLAARVRAGAKLSVEETDDVMWVMWNEFGGD